MYIIYKTHINCDDIKPLLYQLLTNDLIEQRKQKNRNKTYLITKKGQRTLLCAKKLDKNLPFLEPELLQ